MAPDIATTTETKALRKLGACLLAMGSGWLVLALYSVHAALPSNALELAGGRSFFWRAILPEGWAFFSRDARKNDPVAYIRAADGTWSLVQSLPRAHIQYALGLDRQPRALGLEMALLLDQAREAVRMECRSEAATCLEKAPTVAKVKNQSPRPRLCGEVGIAFTQAIPWAWSQSHQGKPIQMPAHFLRLEVACSLL